MTESESKIALVTGANRGLGKAISIELAKRGCLVYLGVREPGKAKEVVETIKKLDTGRAVELVLDVACSDSIDKASQAFSDQQSTLDILVNNAGVFLEEKTDCMLDVPASVYEQEFRINVMGPLQITNAFHPFLSAAKQARVINMSSLLGQLSSMEDENYGLGYGVSKTALNALTRKQAIAFSSDQIDVNCMSPGWVRTDMGGEEAPRTLEQGADTAVWLALDCKSGVTGQFFQDRKPVAW